MAGESVVRIGQIRDDLIVVELALGALLLSVTFAGSFIVGLRASAPIEQIRRRQAEFTADASHELRTPLSVIQAEVDLALSRDRDPTSYRATLERVASESQRLRSIVDDLLWLARYDGDAPPSAAPTVTDVAAAAGRCATRFDAVAAAGSVELVLGSDPGTVAPVLAGAEAIDRLISVLLDNACRYAGAGGRVELRVTGSSGRVTLSVDDSGSGHPPRPMGPGARPLPPGRRPTGRHRPRAGHRRCGRPLERRHLVDRSLPTGWRPPLGVVAGGTRSGAGGRHGRHDRRKR